MKTNCFTLWFIIFFFGCNLQINAQMTAQEQENAKKEIAEVVRTIFMNLQNMDAEALYESYDESPDFIQMTTTGDMIDFQTAKNEHASWFKTLSSLKVTPIKEACSFLTSNTAIYSWFGKFEMTTKQNMQLKNDKFGTTFILQKIGNQWKVIHQQASSLPPAPVKE